MPDVLLQLLDWHDRACGRLQIQLIFLASGEYRDYESVLMSGVPLANGVANPPFLVYHRPERRMLKLGQPATTTH